MTPYRFTKIKIAIGYSLLLAVLLFSLLFVRWEMENLAASDDQQNLQADSLLLLLREKDENTIRMLRVLSEANDSMLSAGEIEEIIAEQDSVITRQRVQNRVITKRDSLITKPRKKGFFKRLGEVFAPSKRDSAVLVNTSLEVATDTILEPYYTTDSLHQKIRSASQQKQAQQKSVRRNNVKFRRLDTELTARIDTLVKGYEQEVLLRTREDAAKGKEIRQRSTRIIGGIAVGAVLLSAFFLILIWRDITRSNRYRRQLEDANRRAEELLDTREKLMLAITHDFKAPLGSIMGYTDLLARLTEDERQRFYLDNMKSSSGHLLKLVNDLLDFHRLDLNKAEVNRVAFHPSHLFEEIRVSFEPLTAAKGLALHYQIAPELDGRFISDPLRIRQIVNNLLSNAVKFTAQGEVRLLVSYASSRLVVEVADTGQGMTPADRERIFQEFTRLPGAQGEEGFGLGLSIVHKLTSLLEGQIDVESTPGEGSRFRVTLPLYPVGGEANVTSQDEGTSRMETSPCGKHCGKHHLRVLLIDDDKIQLTLTAAMLAQQGITAVCCEQLDELTGQLRTSTFDLLLTDVQMPAINGFDLLRLLRASNIAQARTIPVIAVTARSDMQRQEFVEHGFAGCLHKPFTVAELHSIVDGIVIGDFSLSVAEEAPAKEAPVEQPAPSQVIDFSLLTAFSEEDAAGGRDILMTFIEETRKNRNTMNEALAGGDVDGVAAMAHKLLPLLTYIRATRATEVLTGLEARRGETPSEEWRQKSDEALVLVQEVIDEAERYSAGL